MFRKTKLHYHLAVLTMLSYPIELKIETRFLSRRKSLILEYDWRAEEKKEKMLAVGFLHTRLLLYPSVSLSTQMRDGLNICDPKYFLHFMQLFFVFLSCFSPHISAVGVFFYCSQDISSYLGQSLGHPCPAEVLGQALLNFVYYTTVLYVLHYSP